jgi:hypothetical protein
MYSRYAAAAAAIDDGRVFSTITVLAYAVAKSPALPPTPILYLAELSVIQKKSN